MPPKLLAELRAIELWDDQYWRSSRHAWWETIAMLNRQQRRAEILSQLGKPGRRCTVATDEQRRDQRVALEVDVNVHSTSGIVPGRSVDISESGMAVILPIELEIGETADLHFKIGAETIRTRAIVKYRNMFHHGFQFMERLPVSLSSDTCQTCGGSGFEAKPLDENGVAFLSRRCPDCDDRTQD